MSATKVAADTSPVTDSEFDLPCQTLKSDCQNPAAAYVWVAHSGSGKGCPREVALCQHHLDVLVAEWARFLAVAVRCSFCHRPLPGTIADNLRVMPL